MIIKSPLLEGESANSARASKSAVSSIFKRKAMASASAVFLVGL